MIKISGVGAFAIGVCLTFVLTLMVLAVLVVRQDDAYYGKIYAGVSIDGVSFAGMSQEKSSAHFQDIARRLKEVKFEMSYKGSPVATFSGEMLSLQTNGNQLVDQAYAVGRTGGSLDRLLTKLLLRLRMRKYSFTTYISSSLVPIQETILILQKQYDRDPQDALFEIKDGKVTAFVQEHDGLAIDSDRALEQAQKLLSRERIYEVILVPRPLSLDVTSSILKPRVTLAKANTLGIEEIIGVGRSDYSGSIQGRIHNLLLASERLHGTLIPQGEEFSFNRALGEVSGKTGYQPAYVILNGRTQLGDGGGVCQTSTTMFRAAIASGLPITVWAPHAYRVHYYENDGKPGRDATVYAPSQDLKFTNDTPSAILIQTHADTDNNLLTYTFWGKKDDRKISISEVGMSSPIPAPPSREEEDPTIPRGERRQVDWAADGLTAWFDYKVVRGKELIQERRFVSNYRPWQAVYLVGTKE